MVAKLTKLDTSAITNILEDWFIDVGKPLRLRSDGGPQFRTPFIEWCEKMGIQHELSSPDHHESNGHAESAVKAMKHLLAKSGGSWKAFRKGLIEWRNTPRCSDGFSPAQWALGRRQRSGCPALPNAYDRVTDQDFSKALTRREEVMEKVKKDFDKDRRSLSTLPVDTLVVLQNFKTRRWERKGTIVERKPGRNTYVVEVEGRNFLRNRRFLRPCLQQLGHEVPELLPSPEVDEVGDQEEVSAGTRSPTAATSPEPVEPRRSKRQGKRKAESDYIYY